MLQEIKMKTTEIKPWTYSVKPEVDFESGEITFNEIINGFQNKYIREVLKTKEEATKKALIALGWTPPQPIAHDKAETGEMECAAFKRMMSEGSSDIMSKIIASENKSMERDFEIWWKQEWSFGEEPSAAEVYAILKKCTINVKRNRKVLEDKIEQLENENHDLKVKYVLQNPCTDRSDMEDEVAHLKSKLSEAREVMECALAYYGTRNVSNAVIKIKSFLSSLNEADKTKENG